MDFLENAVSVAKDVLDVACKKTDEVISSGKLRFDISNMESKLKKDYEQLGKMYYEMIAQEDTEDDVLEKLKKSIAAKQRKIDLLKASVENNRVCPTCGLPVFKNSIFCNSCGAKLEFED